MHVFNGCRTLASITIRFRRSKTFEIRLPCTRLIFVFFFSSRSSGIKILSTDITHIYWSFDCLSLLLSLYFFFFLWNLFCVFGLILPCSCSIKSETTWTPNGSVIFYIYLNNAIKKCYHFKFKTKICLKIWVQIFGIVGKCWFRLKCDYFCVGLVLIA